MSQKQSCRGIKAQIQKQSWDAGGHPWANKRHTEQKSGRKMDGGGNEDINAKTTVGRKTMGGKMTKYKEWTRSYLITQQLYG